MTTPFVHLHVHTVYSLLDGFSNIKKLVKRAKEMDMPALAITDHGTMFGVIEFFNAAKEAGVKPLIGIETYMAARGMKDRDSKLDKKSSHLLLLAENETGYRNLLAIASAAQLDGFYYYPRIDHDFLAAHAEGLICTSGCMGAEIPRALMDENPEEAVRRMNWYYDVFGPERFFVELQSHNIKELTDLNKKLVEMGAKYSSKFVATNDVHYIEPGDAKYQDVLLAIQTGALLKDENRMRMTDPSYYLRTPEEMARLFAEVPSALTNTVEIAERCSVDLSFKGYHLPEFPVPADFNAETYLRKLCEEGLIRRYGSDSTKPRVRERLDYELGVVHTMGFDAYFLIVWDLCTFARAQGIWYNARGSAAGSIIAYTLDITMVDPIHHGLIFERFLNPGRISMPDIDLDFRDDLRPKMLEYCAKKYGDDKVAQIITFGTMAARGALKDVGRVMEMALPDVDRITKLIPNVPGKPVSLSEALEQVADLRAIYNSEPIIKELIDTAIHMEGTVRNAGTHAAGVVISDKPIVEYLPLHRPTSGSEDTPIKTVTQFEMGILDGMGMLKVDFLGLSTLTVMARACELINERHGVNYDLTNIPIDDPKAFELYGRGQTAGIFQVEGCLSGDTYIGHRTIKELYEDFSAREKACTLQGRNLLRANSCYLDDGRFHLNQIVKAVYSGVKPVYRLSDENQRWIKATADHHFFTQRGWVRLGDLNPETDRLLSKKNTSRAELREKTVQSNNPMYSRPPKTTKTYTKDGYREDLGHYVRSSWEADMARVFLHSGWQYQDEPRTFELTRANGSTFTYTPDFFVPEQDTFYEIKGWMDSVSAEKIALFYQQYPECKLVVVDKTLFAEFQVQYADLVQWECPQFPVESEWVKIREIEFVGEEDTYDLQMLAPGNNFVANGFVVHNSGMTRWMIEMKPQNLDNIIAMVALYRPGPLDFIPSYIKRMHGEEVVQHRHPAMEPIFGDTFGIPIYQEQIMRAAVDLGGYTASESDELRKAISKKQADKIVKHKAKFIKGAVSKDMPQEIAEAIFTDWEEFARYGFNKCLPGDVEILDADSGRLVRIEEIYRRQNPPTRILSTDIEMLRLRPSRMARAMDNGIKPVYRLVTALGRTIEATANHPFYTYDGWKILDHLQSGELIATPRTLPVEGKNEWPEHQVIALGHLLAEGNLCHPHSVYYYNQDDAQVQDFVRAAESFENVQCTVKMHKSIWSVYAARIDRVTPPGIFTWAGELDLLGKTALNKEIPAAAFELTNRQIALLLSRMWEGDGHLDTQSHCGFYATSSERMARQMQHLFLRLDIISRLRKVTFPYKEGRVGWQLYVTGYDNLLAFANTVGVYLTSGKNRNAMTALVAEQPARVMGTKDIVPVAAKELVREAKNRAGITWLQINEQSGIAQREFYPAHTATKRGFTRETMGRLAEYFEDPAMQRLSQNDIYWDEIVSIEYVGEKQTYDLEVPGDHNFVANDIIVHNSHAADYGVISVQTAFLKAHYPAEYMSALMSVFKDDAAKIAMYAADARAMGISVLSPDINYSRFGFTIETKDEHDAIRFSMGAIKNVGQGPVDIIVAARKEGGLFKDLNDFSRRADLRSVGKRSLECLIKVGAMDSFGDRAALLATIDQLVAASASHFRSVEAGQMSMFGGMTGVQEENIILPNIKGDRKEMLNWERELIGLYLSDHPLSIYTDLLTKAVSHNALTLTDARHEEQVRVAGMVATARPYRTKSDKLMGFVTLEDMTGNIELVIFPRTWEKYREMCVEGKVIVVNGKVDAANQPPKVLVDSISTDATYYESPDVVLKPDGGPLTVDRGPVAVPVKSVAQTKFNGGPKTEDRGKPEAIASVKSQMSAPVAQTSPSTVYRPPSIVSVAEPSPIYIPAPADDDLEDDMPPEPESPPDWEMDAVPVGAFAAPPTPMDDMLTLEKIDEKQFKGESLSPSTVYRPPSVETPPATINRIQTYQPIAPIAEPAPDNGQPPQLLTVLLRPSGDSDRDRRRIKNVYGILIGSHGKDRFQFQIFENGKGHLIDFPNDTTRITAEMLDRLKKLMGSESWRVEEL